MLELAKNRSRGALLKANLRSLCHSVQLGGMGPLSNWGGKRVNQQKLGFDGIN